MVSNYQAYVIVGGQVWMNLDTAVATTWVMALLVLIMDVKDTVIQRFCHTLFAHENGYN